MLIMLMKALAEMYKIWHNIFAAMVHIRIYGTIQLFVHACTQANG